MERIFKKNTDKVHILFVNKASLTLNATTIINDFQKDKVSGKELQWNCCILDKYIESGGNDCYSVLKFIGVSESEGNVWNINYQERPDKYIVFNTAPLKSAHCIIGEGATGIAARHGVPVYFKNRGEMTFHLSRLERKEDDLRRNIHKTCHRLLALPLALESEAQKGTKVKGVLRFDIYKEHKEFNKQFIDDYYSKGEKNRVFLALQKTILSLIDEATEEAKKCSYKIIYKGIELLENLKSIGNSINEETKNSNNKDEFQKINKKVYDQILHLFFVFKRHTYIGEEEIMKRVVYFSEDIRKAIELPTDFSLNKYLDQFKSHENLMLYESSGYRDHFMHQFHVFVVGYIMLNNYGFDKIQKSLNDKLSKIEIYKNIKLEKVSVLRIWVLTAFFHDICYLFEKFGKGISSFLNKMMKMNIPVTVSWDAILRKEFEIKDSSKGVESSKYMQYLQKMVLFLGDVEIANKLKIVGEFIQAILGKNDHAVLSSLYLLDQYDTLPREEKQQRNESVPTREIEFYFASLAISLHNGIYKHLQTGSQYEISLEVFPIEFLLIYSDLIQEWGRTKKINNQTYDYEDSPNLEKFSCDSKEITCVLCYPTLNHPAKETLEAYTEGVKCHLISKTRFNVTYKFSNDTEHQVSFKIYDSSEESVGKKEKKVR